MRKAKRCVATTTENSTHSSRAMVMVDNTLQYSAECPAARITPTILLLDHGCDLVFRKTVPLTQGILAVGLSNFLGLKPSLLSVPLAVVQAVAISAPRR